MQELPPGFRVKQQPQTTMLNPSPTLDAQVRQAENEADASELDRDLQAARIRQAQAAASASGASAAASAANANRTNLEAERLENRLTDAQRKVDENYAKEYVDWNAAGGYAGLETNLKLLEDSIDILEASDTVTGSVIGRMPKFIQQNVNPDAVDVRADVEKVIQQSLKAILGAQFAMREADQLFARSFDPTQPEASNIKRIRTTIEELRTRGRAKDSAARYYEENGTLAGWSPADKQGGVFDQMYAGQGPQMEAAGSEATTRSVAVPPAMQAESQAIIQRLMAENGGRLPPDEYARLAGELERKYNDEIKELTGQGDLRPQVEAHKEWAEGFNEYLSQGGKKVPSIQALEVPLSQTEIFKNKAVSNPLGAGAVGALNAGSFGSLNALSPEGMAAISDAYPKSLLVGEIAGGLTGTAALGALGRNTVGRVAPNLLGGGGRAQFGRNLATDGTYAGIYSANSGENVGIGTGLGVGGSVFGQALGKGFGATVGGVQRSAPVQDLLNRGVPLTVGRQLGDAGSRFEDLMQSVPFVGGQVRNRMGESFEGFNRAAFDEAAKPLEGFNPTSIGREGVSEFSDAVSGAYKSALGGRTIPLDEGQLVDDLVPATQARAQLPEDVAARAEKLIGNHLNPMQDAGQITGETFQRAARGLKKARGNAGQIAGEFDQPYRETMTGVIDALEGQVRNSADADMLGRLNAANDANRSLNILENASLDRARVGTRTGQTEVFAPSQLIDAARASERKYPGSEALLQLGKSGQDVLPQTVPNSGTTDRALAASALGALGIGASGVGMNDAGVTYDSTNLGTAASLAAALSLLGTKQGQQALSKVIFERPTIAQQVGKTISRRSGLFGSGVRQYALQGQ